MFDLVAFIPRAVMQGIPLLFGSTGETITEKLLESARSRAKQLLEDYVKNIGKLSDTAYTVTFTDISPDDTAAPVTNTPETKK